MNLRKNDEGVSPVIGVILMVAITVVLAAVVFVLVTNLGGTTDNPVSLGVSKESDDSFTITSIAEDDTLTYGDLIIKDNGVAKNYTVNGATPADSDRLEAGDTIVITPALAAGSHRIQFVIESQVVYSKSFEV
jgi:archaeal type IV pilus assembly protein PilA